MSGFPRTGDRFGDYTIDAELGRGGMGVVFRATQLSLLRPVALKVLNPQIAGDADFVRRFEHEATLLASMTSPHIIQVYGHGQVGDCLYLATQYIPGGDLSKELARTGAMPPPLALELTGQVLAALADAHAQGVIHRDVKPSNVLLTTSGDRPFAYLCDFGIAQSGDGELTQTGMIVGSWAFMAPERHKNAPATVRSDVYSAGCLLWCTLTGGNPYSGTDVQVAMAHISSPVPQLDGTDPLTSYLNQLLLRSLAKDPADRYASAADFLRAVQAPLPAARSTTRRFADVTPTEERTRVREAVAATTLRPPPPPPPVPTRTTGEPPSSPPAHRNRIVLFGSLAAAGVAIVTVLAVLLTSRTGAPVAIADPAPSAPAMTAKASSPSASKVAYVCWDGQPASGLNECTEPHGTDGIHYLYPSMAADWTKCSRGGTTSETKLAIECHYGKNEMIKYSFWGSTVEAQKHYVSSYADVDPTDLVLDGEVIGSLYDRNGVKAGAYRMSGTWLGARFSFSVSAPTRARQLKLAAKVRLRAVANVRGYQEGTEPRVARPSLP